MSRKKYVKTGFVLSTIIGAGYFVLNIIDKKMQKDRYENAGKFLMDKKERIGKSRALILASVASMIDQFNMNNIRILLDLGYDVEVAADFVDGGNITEERITDLKERLAEMGVSVYHVPIPRKVSNVTGILNAYKQVRKLCNEREYKIIHCHSPIGGVVTRVAARKARHNGTKIIYTAHGFHFYDGAPKKNWLLFYPIEKICSLWTDFLITINQEDYKRAKRKFYAGKTAYIPGVGVDTEKFTSLHGIGLENKRTEIGADDGIMLLSVGELNVRKNHEVIIKALKVLNNPAIKYFIVGPGILKEHLMDLASALDLENQVILLGYRTDIPELCQAADLFVFPSVHEGLPVALMEAMASGLPIVCSDIRGNRDLIVNGKNGILVGTNEVNAYAQAIETILNDKKVQKNMSIYNRKRIKRYDRKIVDLKMKYIYENIQKEG